MVSFFKKVTMKSQVLLLLRLVIYPEKISLHAKKKEKEGVLSMEKKV